MKYILIILAVFVLFSVLAVVLALNKKKHMENHKKLVKGMLLTEAISLMGKDYEKEETPKFIVYKWTMKSSTFKGVNDVRIRVKDGKVIEVQRFIR